jgi:hypothetical protein
LLGVADSVINHVPLMLGEIATARAERSGWSQAAEFAGLILDAGWAWAATAVLVGWLVTSQGYARGALAGGLALVSATAAYYGTDLLFDGGGWWGSATRYWLIGSVVFGLPLGAAGALIRRPGLVGVAAALLVPAGAAVQMALLPPPADSRMADPVRLTVWIAALVAVVLLMWPRGSARREPATAAQPRRS